MKEKIVWQFTNKRELTSSEFIRYFESKVKKTIRKYQMPISLLQEKTLKARVLNSIIKNLPERKGKLSDENLNNISNKIIYIMMYGKESQLKKLLPKNQPLYFLSDKEIELYAKIKKIKGKLEKPKSNLKEIDNFVVKIEEKNPDIRHNIVNALLSTWRQFYKI
ncbi:MAG TPA: hypothetical protein VMZ91_12720 [Candidatus Paceibacterota bacterium]|nr:hypothetical protein [Candidatus Paceibacterota bacterium]